MQQGMRAGMESQLLALPPFPRAHPLSCPAQPPHLFSFMLRAGQRGVCQPPLVVEHLVGGHLWGGWQVRWPTELGSLTVGLM